MVSSYLLEKLFEKLRFSQNSEYLMKKKIFLKKFSLQKCTIIYFSLIMDFYEKLIRT